VRVTAARLAAAAVLLTGPGLLAPNAIADASVGLHDGTWVLSGWTTRSADYTDQGLTTVTSPGGGTRIVTRGDDSIPPVLAAAGWQHVGDPDSYRGYILDAYQSDPTGGSKLYTLTAPDGTRHLYVHRLAPGEMYNNSFTAIAPGGRWFVSGEWGTMRRLLVFAMPSLPPAGSRIQPLPLAGVISLDRPVRNVQGCAFASATELVCATNDRSDDLFGVAQQLLRVQLPRPLDGRPLTASVQLLGTVPGVSACQGTAEVEGIDIHGRRMTVSVVSACIARTTLYTFHRAGAAA
jgi:hypothetical protein